MLRRSFALLLIFASCVVLAATAAVAGVPARTELSAAGGYVHPKGQEASWFVDGRLAAPLGEKGIVLFGPNAHLDSDDARTALGAVLEVNFAGTHKSGLYLGFSGLYNLKAVEGVDRHTVDAEAGLKVQFGAGGSGLRLAVSETVWGRGSDSSDPRGTLGAFLRF